MRLARSNRALLALALATTLSATLVTAGCNGDTAEKTQILVLFPGSLIQPLGEIEERFEAANPDVDVVLEGHGSIQAIRQVSDLHRDADVVLSADDSLLPMLLYTASDPDTGEAYADWHIDFATNEMCLAYSPDSAYADEITPENWYDVIRRPGVRLGISDPRFDANGYRALMVLKMADDYYGEPTIFFDVTAGRLTHSIGVSEEDGLTVLSIPEIVETTEGSDFVVRMNSLQLLPLLQSGDLDYAFEYVSVTRQHGLEYIDLPAELDLGDEALNDVYDDIRVDVELQNYVRVEPRFFGSSIVYGATTLSDSAHPEEAERFLAFLLGPEGRQVLEEYDHPTLPLRADEPGNVPGSLRALLEDSGTE